MTTPTASATTAVTPVPTVGMTPAQALDAVIEAAGGTTRLGEKLEVDPQVISNWRRRGLPDRRVLELEAVAIAEGIAVRRHHLCPALYPVEVAEQERDETV